MYCIANGQSKFLILYSIKMAMLDTAQIYSTSNQKKMTSKLLDWFKMHDIFKTLLHWHFCNDIYMN